MLQEVLLPRRTLARNALGAAVPSALTGDGARAMLVLGDDVTRRTLLRRDGPAEVHARRFEKQSLQ
jgi:hypothetical protein